MNVKFLKATLAVVCMVAAGAGSWKAYNVLSTNETNLLLEQNIEALSRNESSGAKCPNGCRNIGWVFDKILECDCEYDHLSCCKSWGC